MRWRKTSVFSVYDTLKMSGQLRGGDRGMVRFVSGFAAVCFGLCVWAASADAQDARDTVRVQILHSNDVYGQLLPETADALGGMARRVHLIRRLQAAGPTLALDAGDAIGPATLSAWDRGATMVAAMRTAGYAAMTPGNHEFDHGLEVLRQRQAEGGFPLLAANIQGIGGADPPIAGRLLTDVEGVKIGILGVVSAEIATQTNPKHVANLRFGDPIEAARDAARALRDEGAAYVIVLAHMPQRESLLLAQRVEGVDLVIAGGYRGLERTFEVPSLTRLVNGAHVVTTPRLGPYLGRVVVTFLPVDDGGYRAGPTQATLIPVGAEEGEAAETAEVVAALEADYAASTGEALGQIEGKTLEAQAEIVANLMRRHTGREVGLVNLGAFEPVPSGQPLYVRDINRFIRFDDMLVKMVLTGRQIEAIARQSARLKGEGKGLVFAGLDVKAMTVNRRPVQKDEAYHVVTVEFLAEGGDGYRDFRKGASVAHTGISLRSLVAAELKAWGASGVALSSQHYDRLNRKGIWRSGWGVEGAFRRNYVDRTTGVYQDQGEQVSFLRGETSVAWNGASRYFLSYELGPHVMLFENSADLGQLGESFGNLETVSDRLDADATYRYRIESLKVDPVVSTGVSTAFTRSVGSRPFRMRGSAGFQKPLPRGVVVRFAGRGQRDFVAKVNDYGAEVTLIYRRRIRHGGRFHSKVESFFGLSDRKVISVENYNTFSFPLVGALSLVVRQNNFLYRVDKIQATPVSGVAFRTDVTVGVAYGRDWKWF